MVTKTYRTVDAYLKDVPEGPRAHLQAVRESVKTLAPDAVESVSYGIPTFKYKGKPLLYYGAAKEHLALYGAIPAAIDAKDLAKYDISKGTIRFPLDKPIPAALVKKIVRARTTEIDVQLAAKKPPARKTAAAAR